MKGWCLKRLPTLAGLVTGVLVNPVVGKLVPSADDAAVDQLDRVAEDLSRARSVSRWGG